MSTAIKRESERVLLPDSCRIVERLLIQRVFDHEARDVRVRCTKDRALLVRRVQPRLRRPRRPTPSPRSRYSESPHEAAARGPFRSRDATVRAGRKPARSKLTTEIGNNGASPWRRTRCRSSPNNAPRQVRAERPERMCRSSRVRPPCAARACRRARRRRPSLRAEAALRPRGPARDERAARDTTSPSRTTNDERQSSVRLEPTFAYECVIDAHPHVADELKHGVVVPAVQVARELKKLSDVDQPSTCRRLRPLRRPYERKSDSAS